jgi:hypothetical protein
MALLTMDFNGLSNAQEVAVRVDLMGKDAIVTGAASGIGFPIVQALTLCIAAITPAV